MKNLFNREEFKNIKENNLFTKSQFDNEKLFEAPEQGGAADFSNRIGWSDSLLGRLTNKLFSGVKTYTDMIVLGRLNTKFEDELFKAILKSYAQNNTIEELKTVDMSVTILLVEKNDIDNNVSEITDYIEHDDFQNNTYKFDITKDEYSTRTFLIFPSDQTNVDVISPKMVSEKEEEIVLEFEVITKDKKKNAKYKIDILFKDVQDEKETPLGLPQHQEEEKKKNVSASPQDKKETPLGLPQHQEEEKKKDVLALPQHQEDSKSLVLYATSNKTVKYNNKGELVPVSISKKSQISEGGEYVAINKNGEYKKIKVISLTTTTKKDGDSQVQTGEKLDDNTVYVKFLESENKMSVPLNKIYTIDAYKKAKDIKSKFSAEEIVSINKMMKEGYEMLNNVGCSSRDPKTCKLSQDILENRVGNLESGDTYKERVNYFNIFKKKIQKIQNMSNESNSYDMFLNNKAWLEFADYINEVAQSQPKISGEKTDKIVIKSVDAEDSKKFKSKKSISKLLSTSKLDKNDKELIRQYGNIDSIDKEELTKKFIENPELRKLATQLVNKEALKEIALRAQWLYDGEKYKDKRNDAYSRVNFTKTGPDMAKLENDWKQKISKTKKLYTPFFTDENGNFPKILDPIALLTSDERFRKEFDQFNPDNNKVSNIKTTDIGNNSTLSKDEEHKLKLISNKDIIDFGILKVSDTKYGKTYGIYVQKVKYEKMVGYKYIGMFNINEALKESKNVTDESKIKEIINKYSHVKNVLGDENVSKEMKEFYKSIRYRSDSWKDSLLTIFFRNKSVSSGRGDKTRFVQICTPFSKNGEDYVSDDVFVTISDDKNTKIEEISKIDVNFQYDEKKKYSILLNVIEVMKIDKMSYYENIDVGLVKEQDRNDVLFNKKDIMSIIQERILNNVFK